MRALALTAALAALSPPAGAEMRDEQLLVGDRVVKVSVFEPFEILTVGPDEFDQMQVLSNADLEIVASPTEADSALVGQPVLVVEGIGTHSCEAGDAREYWVVTLGDPPAPQGPLTSCESLTPRYAQGAMVLGSDDAAPGWAWTPGKGWTAAE